MTTQNDEQQTPPSQQQQEAGKKPKTTGRQPDFDIHVVTKKDTGEDDWKRRGAVWLSKSGYLIGQFGKEKVVLSPRKPKQPPQDRKDEGQPPPVVMAQADPALVH